MSFFYFTWEIYAVSKVKQEISQYYYKIVTINVAVMLHISPTLWPGFKALTVHSELYVIALIFAEPVNF